MTTPRNAEGFNESHAAAQSLRGEVNKDRSRKRDRSTSVAFTRSSDLTSFFLFIIMIIILHHFEDLFSRESSGRKLPLQFTVKTNSFCDAACLSDKPVNEVVESQDTR
ncbi:hypothetical protein F2P81_008402 [Scophthalmus maximus]|uniref:Transmembrane protein n=1 Tax=Scophthalmus maximus TaxID=52904 RepID=A0A6A4T267_SCOMX|nr:hypothetical protein F2P81_008402 [Scophthalmus maximus]